jgi:hypothetical protein
MSEIVAVKVPKPLKERMRKVSRKVNWPEEIRRFVEERARQAESEERMREVLVLLRKTGQTSKGFAEASVREDRDGR